MRINILEVPPFAELDSVASWAALLLAAMQRERYNPDVLSFAAAIESRTCEALRGKTQFCRRFTRHWTEPDTARAELSGLSRLERTVALEFLAWALGERLVFSEAALPLAALRERLGELSQAGEVLALWVGETDFGRIAVRHWAFPDSLSALGASVAGDLVQAELSRSEFGLRVAIIPAVPDEMLFARH